MEDAHKFQAELLNAYLEKHPKQKEEDSVLGVFAKVFAEIATMAIEKYDRERSQ